MSAESVALVMSLQISPESDVAALAGDQQAAAELLETISGSVIDAGDRVVVIHRAQCRRRRDTPECTIRRPAIRTVRDSRVVHVDFNLPCSEAMAAIEAA